MSINSDIIRQTTREFEQKKLGAENRAREVKNEIYQKIPILAEIEKQLSENSLSIAKTIFASTPDEARLAVLQLEKRANLLISRRAEIIASSGLPSDALQVKYQCRGCEDTGFSEDGARCECFKLSCRKKSFGQLNSVSPLKLSSFDDFNLGYYDNREQDGINPRVQMDSIYDFCITYSDDLPYSTENILMLGGTGLGKTHLSLAIARRAISKDMGVVYDSCENLLVKIQQERFSSNSDKTLNFILSCDLLIIDDLGSEFSGNFSQSVMYNIINTRMNRSLPTVISTNLNLVDIDKQYGARILSRLTGSYITLHFAGNDIRQLMHQN